MQMLTFNNTLHGAPARLIAALVLAAVVMLAALSPASAQAPVERDFFGTVVTNDATGLVVATNDGDVLVLFTDDTEVHIPSQNDASITDLLPGDVVAVSLEEKDGLLVADKIYLVPGKTRDRHIPGEVVGLTDDEITVLTSGTSETLTVLRNDETEVRFHQDTADLVIGDFVVIVARRESTDVAPVALEINVTRKPAVASGEKPAVDHSKVDDEVSIHGVLEAIDGQTWTVNGQSFLIDGDTKVKDAVTIGQLVDVEAVLLADGTVLATQVEVEEADKIASTTRLKGVFEGVDSEGRWLISGTPVIVNDDTDTDGVPEVGQAVKVKAILGSDGTLVAREIEIENEFEEDDDGDHDGISEVKIEGIFEGFADDGSWIVNGVMFSVAPHTKIEGKPAVGGSVEVKAIKGTDGEVVASKVESDDETDKRKSETEIHGVIAEILPDAIVINGFTISLSELTEIDGDLVVGTEVKVEALLGDGGALIAREIDVKKKELDDENDERSDVEIEGTVSLINDDGSIVVNGITVKISDLSEIKGSLSLGGKVKIEGVLAADGTLTAEEVKGEGRKARVAKNEVDITGTVNSIEVDADGNITKVVVNGVEITIDVLTEVEGNIELGVSVKAEGVLVDGIFIAGEIDSQERGGGHREHDEEDEPEEGQEQDEENKADSGERSGELKIEGEIDEVILGVDGRIAAIVVSGVEVLINADSKVEGALEEGADVEVKAFADGGVVIATKVEAKERELDETNKPDAPADTATVAAREIELHGTIDDLATDASGSVVVIAVDGAKILINEDTDVEGRLTEGAEVEIVARLTDGALVAIKVHSATKNEGDEPREARFSGKIEKVPINDAGAVTHIGVDGHTLVIDRETDSDVRLVVGVQVQVKAVLDEGQWFARRIEGVEPERTPTPEPTAEPTPAATPTPTLDETPTATPTQTPNVTPTPTPNPTAEPDKEVIDETFEGEIEAIEEDEGAVTHIRVEGTVIIINTETEIDADLVVGANVEVRAVREGDDWIATRVKSAS